MHTPCQYQLPVYNLSGDYISSIRRL